MVCKASIKQGSEIAAGSRDGAVFDNEFGKRPTPVTASVGLEWETGSLEVHLRKSDRTRQRTARRHPSEGKVLLHSASGGRRAEQNESEYRSMLTMLQRETGRKRCRSTEEGRG